jgi:CspA family cold shock protein
LATGTIRTIRDRGFGFISGDGGSTDGDLFFHSTGVRDGGFTELHVGQRVGYEEEPDPRDPSRRRAVDVRPADVNG